MNTLEPVRPEKTWVQRISPLILFKVEVPNSTSSRLVCLPHELVDRPTVGSQEIIHGSTKRRSVNLTSLLLERECQGQRFILKIIV